MTIKKTLISLIIIVVFLLQTTVLTAQSTVGGQGASDNTIPRAIPVPETGASDANTNKSGAGLTSSAQAIQTKNVGACVGGQLLARLLTSSISSGINSITKNVANTVKETTTRVPITIEGSKQSINQEAELSARTGTFLPVVGTQVGISWDGIAWCIVNTIIDYIVNSTIQWANSGFKGNPAFIRNPEQFFKGLADREASSFIQELAYRQAGGINVCAPFRINIAVGLAGAYNGSGDYMRNYGSCSLSQMQQNAIQSGSYTITTATDWIALTRPENNPYWSFINAGDELNKRISVKRNTATLDLTINRGFLSYKKCKDDSKPESKTNPCDVVTPGGIIAESLSSTLNMPKEKLVSAQKFDQMVDAIVNNLIKIAISKTLEQATGKEASQAVTSDYYSAVPNYYGGYDSYGNYNNTGASSGTGVSGTTGTGGAMLQQILGGARFKNESWNTYAIQQIQASGILNVPISDAARFFPGGVPTAEGYLSIMAAIAEKESGGLAKPERYRETKIGGGNTYSVGLLSLTQGDAEAGNYTYSDLEDPFINIEVGTKIMKNLVSKWGLIQGKVRSDYGGRREGLPMYWSTMQNI